MKKALFGFLILLLSISASKAQRKLQAGFDAREYIQLLQIGIHQMDTVDFPITGPLAAYPACRLAYQSEESGLSNLWQLWIRPDNVGIIAIRATVLTDKTSWLEDFYAGMVPAQGKLQLDSNTFFKYKVAQDSNVYVHAGWIIGLAAMAPDIVSKINEYHAKGIKDFIIFGHSQGGAIAFLLRSYLEYLQPAMPRDITFKTYSSAAPKPGNMYYAYDYDFITRGGWGLRVVNAADWVPQLPIAVQTMTDINKDSPFDEEKELMKQVPAYERLPLEMVFKKLGKTSRKTQKKYTRYLGDRIYPFVHKSLPAYDKPEFEKCFNYTPCGTAVILRPEQNYWDNYYTKNKDQFLIFVHHHYYAYYQLTMYWYPERE